MSIAGSLTTKSSLLIFSQNNLPLTHVITPVKGDICFQWEEQLCCSLRLYQSWLIDKRVFFSMESVPIQIIKLGFCAMVNICLGSGFPPYSFQCQKGRFFLTCKIKRSYGTIRRRDDKGAKKIVYS